MDLQISSLEFPAVAAQPMEIVERKGLGHPDSICDALAEELSRTLSRYYLEHFGLILHHNVDKGLLCGGRARAAFGGGEVLDPITIFLTGRATEMVAGATVPLQELAIDISLTVACAMVGRHIADMPAYLAAKAQVAELARDAARQLGVPSLEVAVNAADGDTLESIYLTVTGTSAESGDDGEVGRGNRVNGLIAFYRPMSMEAAAGKNPVSHVGKLYNLLAQRIAQEVVREVEGVTEAYCCLLGRIGRPIDDPAAVELKLRLAPGVALAQVQSRAGEVARRQLADVGNLWRELIEGRIALF